MLLLITDVSSATSVEEGSWLPQTATPQIKTQREFINDASCNIVTGLVAWCSGNVGLG